MKRKLVSMVMCMALGATMLAGCGNSANTSTGNAGASNDAAAKTDDAAAADQTDDSAEAAGTESSAASGDTVTIGFAQVGHESDWRTASTDSCLSVFSADNGYDLQFVDCDNDSAVQLEAVRGFIEQDVDYIIIDPIVSTGWDTVLTECEEAGIPVIVIDRTIDDSDKYVSWVGSNFKTEGLAAGEWLKAYTDAKGISDVNVLVIEGSTGASATIGRTDGFKEIADANGWNILDSQTGDFTQAGGQEVMESYIKSYEGKFNVVVCQNDNEAFGAIDAIEAAGKTVGSDIANGEIMVISFDTTHAGLQDVLDGKIECDVECNPLHGPRAEELIKKLEAGEDVDKLNYVDEEIFATDDTVDKVKAVNSLDEEGEYDVTPITQEIIDGRAY